MKAIKSGELGICPSLPTHASQQFHVKIVQILDSATINKLSDLIHYLVICISNWYPYWRFQIFVSYSFLKNLPQRAMSFFEWPTLMQS